MARQYMTPRTGMPLIIETPGGLVEIQWDTGRRRRLVITLPDDLKAHRGEARAMKELQFLKRCEDGTLIPDYSLLAPDVDEHGKIRGVRKPERLALRFGT